MGRGKAFSSGERSIILKVLTFFEKEKQQGSPIVPLGRALDRASEATGVSVRTIRNIKNEAKELESTTNTPGTSAYNQMRLKRLKKKKPSGKKLDIDDFTICSIRNVVESFYSVKNEIPTVKKIFAIVKTELNYPGQKTSLRKILKEKLGYRFRKCKKTRDFLVQKPEIAAWRARYLRRLNENDDLGADKKLVTYVGETWIHSHYNIAKCWRNSLDASVKINLNQGQRWIIVQAGNENGFIKNAELIYKCKSSTGYYDDDMNSDKFLIWLNEKLIPNLPPNGIVVIDNAPYHSKQVHKRPTSSSPKDHMQTWLRNQNVNFDEKMTKVELYHLIKLTPKTYLVDELLRSNGHEVLRLPPYQCDLNPIEYIWNLMKQRIADNVTQTDRDILSLTKNAIKSVTPSDWKKKVNLAGQLRQKYWDQARLGEIFEEELFISLEQNSDSDSTVLEMTTESGTVISDTDSMDYDD